MDFLNQVKIMYKTINVDYAENQGWKISLKGLEIGDPSVNDKGSFNYISFEDFSTIRRSEKDVIRYIETLGVLTFLEETGKQSISGEEQRKLAIADRVHKMYENIFTKSYYRGVTAIPIAIKEFYKQNGKAEKIVKKASKKIIQDYPELHEFKGFIREGMQKIVAREQNI
jgi:hypothetical protein